METGDDFFPRENPSCRELDFQEALEISTREDIDDWNIDLITDNDEEKMDIHLSVSQEKKVPRVGDSF